MSRATAYISLQQAAEQLGVSDKTIRNWIATGRLTGYRAGPRMLRVRQEELEAIMRPIPTAVIGR